MRLLLSYSSLPLLYLLCPSQPYSYFISYRVLLQPTLFYFNLRSSTLPYSLLLYLTLFILYNTLPYYTLLCYSSLPPFNFFLRYPILPYPTLLYYTLILSLSYCTTTSFQLYPTLPYYSTLLYLTLPYTNSYSTLLYSTTMPL